MSSIKCAASEDWGTLSLSWSVCVVLSYTKSKDFFSVGCNSHRQSTQSSEEALCLLWVSHVCSVQSNTSVNTGICCDLPVPICGVVVVCLGQVWDQRFENHLARVSSLIHRLHLNNKYCQNAFLRENQARAFTWDDGKTESASTVHTVRTRSPLLRVSQRTGHRMCYDSLPDRKLYVIRSVCISVWDRVMSQKAA